MHYRTAPVPCFIIIEFCIAVRWGNEHLRGGFDITSPDDLKLPIAIAFLFWMYVILNNLLWLKTTKPISFFTFLEKYRYEPLELSDRKRHSQYPDIPPEFLSDRPDGFVLGYKGFTRIRDKLGPDLCFHDLRHYYATIGAVLGVPQSFLEKMGGWSKGSNTMQRVYQGTIKSLEDEYNNKMANHFNNLI